MDPSLWGNGWRSRRLGRSIPLADNGRKWTRTLISPDASSRWSDRAYGEMSFRLVRWRYSCSDWFLRGRVTRRSSVIGSVSHRPSSNSGRAIWFPQMLESPVNWKATTRSADSVMKWSRASFLNNVAPTRRPSLTDGSLYFSFFFFVVKNGRLRFSPLPSLWEVGNRGLLHCHPARRVMCI